MNWRDTVNYEFDRCVKLSQRLSADKLARLSGSDLIRLSVDLRNINDRLGYVIEVLQAGCADLVDATREHDPELYIPNDVNIIGATHNDQPLRFWDDGFGPTWVYRDTMGVVGVVRANSWADAYQCVIDEIMPDADPEDAEIWDGETLAEGYHFRSSGVPSAEELNSHVAQEDLNGSMLQRLTPDLANELGIALKIERD